MANVDFEAASKGSLDGLRLLVDRIPILRTASLPNALEVFLSLTSSLLLPSELVYSTAPKLPRPVLIIEQLMQRDVHKYFTAIVRKCLGGFEQFKPLKQFLLMNYSSYQTKLDFREISHLTSEQVIEANEVAEHMDVINYANGGVFLCVRIFGRQYSEEGKIIGPNGLFSRNVAIVGIQLPLTGGNA